MAFHGFKQLYCKDLEGGDIALLIPNTEISSLLDLKVFKSPRRLFGTLRWQLVHQAQKHIGGQKMILLRMLVLWPIPRT